LRVYIAGPIAGMPDGNKEAFLLRVKQLTDAGHEPLNPWDIGAEHEGYECIGEPVEHSTDHLYGCYLRGDIMRMMFCDGISLLDGWENSKGAVTEEHVARSIGLKLVTI
jgi:Domain of unknown function (DUF4406)